MVTFESVETEKQLDPFDQQMLSDVKEVITWAAQEDPRTKQVAVGPSELGGDCDRQLAYRLAGLAPVNPHLDRWPAQVGSAIHRYLEEAIGALQQQVGATRWLTETTVQIDPMVFGHCDLYDMENLSVWDFKTAGTDKIRKFRKNGPPGHYRTQVQLYGLGMSHTGRRVDRVGLVVLPRSGWLSEAWAWSEEYDPQVAQQALDRMYRVTEQAMELAIDQRPEQVLAIEAAPSRLCSFCPFYQSKFNKSEVTYGCPAE